MDASTAAIARVRSRLPMCAGLCVLLLGGLLGSAQAQPGRRVARGRVVRPSTSEARMEDRGRRAHTNHLLFVPDDGDQGGATPYAASTTPRGLSPAEVWAAYGLPSPSSLAAAAGSGVIAIVDAFDYPGARTDFNAFSQQFGLPQENGSKAVFEVVYANGVKPRTDTGWSQEAALDIEWAHAMAPAAKIVLVEAASDSINDLLTAVKAAGRLPGVREVSMSWGTGEFSQEASYDTTFSAPGVVYFAASGDVGGEMSWPAAAPNVVGVGGTTLTLDGTGAFVSETGWSDSGGGTSVYETRPAYQSGVQALAKAGRGVPDLSLVADPSTGVSVYWQGGWIIVGGTSLSTPAIAGLSNLAATVTSDGFASDSVDHLTNRIYAHLGDSSPSPGLSDYFRDIISGTAGANTCTSQWDAVTGVGSPWQVHGAQAAPPPTPAPVASFTMAPAQGTAPLSVTFTDTSTNAPTAWAWSFGDGGTSTAQSPTHRYANPGRYPVSLTVTNGGGSNTKTAVVTTTFRDVSSASWAESAILACVEAGIVSGYPDGSYAPDSTVTRDQMAVYIARALAGGDDKVPAGPATASFIDVPSDSWAYKYIEYAKSRGVVTGYGDGSYGPGQAVDRATMAVYISRAIANPTGDTGLSGYMPPAASSFVDVPTDFWARTYIEYAKSKGVVSGYPDGSYQPGAVVTRDQMAVFVARAFGLQ